MVAVLSKLRDSEVTVSDEFCGAGGSSSGARAAGMRVRLAINHWDRAIQTHNTNFPEAEHVLTDISTSDPRRFPHTDVLIASPSCTFHSGARSRPKEPDLLTGIGFDEAERSRATMMDVPRFAEVHRYEVVIVENVVEVTRWPGFEPWLAYMTNLGYDHQVASINSLTAQPTPQSRDRVYFVFHRRGNQAPDLAQHPLSWCPECESDVQGVFTWRHPGLWVGKYRQQYDFKCPRCQGLAYPYAYPAAAAIDWSLPIQRIGDRKKPLATATMRRVEAGYRQFGPDAEDPGPAGRARRAGMVPVPEGWLVPLGYSQDDDKQPRSVAQPGLTQTGRLETGLAVPPEPFICELRGGWSDARSIQDPLATVCASGNHHALCRAFMGTSAFVVKNYGGVEAAESMVHRVQDPLGTVTAVDHHSLVTQPGEPFLTSYYGNGGVSSVRETVPTVTTRDRFSLVAPAVEDCGFRMLEPHEVGRAMAFPSDYVVLGNKREVVRQLGNAVTPPVMKLLCERVMATLR
jgi:DNA (cytosine-5)-methyltransferase 1